MKRVLVFLTAVILFVLSFSTWAFAITIRGSFPDGTVGEEYSAILSVSGGEPVYSWWCEGLPTGLDYTSSFGTNFDHDKLMISGTPREYGTFQITIHCRDMYADETKTTLRLFIYDKPEISSIYEHTITAGTTYKATIRTKSGTAPFKWTLSGESWLTLQNTTGESVVIFAAPTMDDEGGSFTLTCTDANNKTDIKRFYMEVGYPIVFPDKEAQVGKEFSTILRVDYGDAPYSFTCEGIPEELGLEYGRPKEYPAGYDYNMLEIRGTPKKFGTITVKVKIQDAFDEKEETSFKIKIYDENGNMPSNQVYGSLESHGLSARDAWEIDSVTTLKRLQTDVNEGRLNNAQYFKLTNDLDLTSYSSWMPIGGRLLVVNGVTNEDPVYQRPFVGYFDGNGHTIKLNINDTISDRYHTYQGLFGTIYGGWVKNLSVTGKVNVTKATMGSLYVGGIAANLVLGSIENCKFDGQIAASIQNTGGVRAGGIVGSAGWSYHVYSLKNCKVGSVSDTSISSYGGEGTQIFAGGLIGGLYDSSSSIQITGNYARVNLTGKSCGGIYGGYADLAHKVATISNNTVIDLSSPTPTETIKITTTSIADGKVGTAYSSTLKSDVSGVTWTAEGLPNGLTINKSTGIILGTPRVSGEFKVTITATKGESSAEKEFTLTITANSTSETIKITTTSLASGKVGTAYSDTLTSNTSGVTWSVSYGNLPDGLKLNASTGAISGTPTKSGTFDFTIRATKGTVYTTNPYTIKIEGASSSKVTITTTSLLNGKVGSNYISTLGSSVSGVTWSVSSGNLPDGLKLNASTGSILGRPTKAGNYTFTVKAQSGTDYATKEYTIKIEGATSTVTVSITKTSLSNGKVGTAYSDTLTSNTSGVTWSVSGNFPSDLTLDKNTGEIYGTPKTANTYNFTVRATHTSGSYAQKSYTLTINAAPSSEAAPRITTTKLKTGKVGKKYTPKVKASGRNITWSASGLPAGVEINPSIGKFSGLPENSGTYNVRVTATNSGGSDTKTFSVVINDIKPNIKGKAKSGKVGDDYLAEFYTTKGTGNIVWTLTPENLPEGLEYEYDTEGLVIYGTPEETWKQKYTLTATNSAGSKTKKFTLKIKK